MARRATEGDDRPAAAHITQPRRNPAGSRHVPDETTALSALDANDAFQERWSIRSARRLSGTARMLERLNIHEAALFPDLAGLCEQIEREHTVLPDEDWSNPPEESARDPVAPCLR